MNGDDGRGPFGTLLLELRTGAGLSQQQVGRLFRLTRQAVGRWESGDNLPEETRARTLDTTLNANGRLLAAWRVARIADRAAQDGTDLSGVMTTDRREFGGAGVAAILAAAGVASDEMATADPTPRTLEMLEGDCEDIGAALWDVPHDVMLPRAGEVWRQADMMLARRLTDPVEQRVLVVAGVLATKLVALGVWLNRTDVVREFSVLADLYADRSGDPILIGSVACMRAARAKTAGHYARAAAIAAKARPGAHPRLRPRLAAYEAESWAAAGHVDSARAALDAMREESIRAAGSAWCGTPWAPADEVIFSSFALVELRDGDLAARLAREYIDSGEADLQGVGLGHVTIGRGMLYRDRPDPGAAAFAGVEALSSTASLMDGSVVRRVGGLYGELARRWSDLSEVRRLGGELAGARAALSA